MYRVTTYIIRWKNTTRNTKTSTLTVTLLNKIESIRIIVTAITVTKEAWLPFGFNCCHNRLVLHRNTLWSQAASCLPHCEYPNSLLSHWLPATQIFPLSNLKHIPLFKLLSMLHVHSWVIFRFVIASMSIWCHWMSWQFRLFFFEFADQPILKTLSVIF